MATCPACLPAPCQAFADFYAVKPPVLLGGEDGADAAAAGAAAGDACGSTGRGAAAAADGGDGGGAGRSQQPAASPSQQGQPEEGAAGRPTAAGADGDGLPGPPGASCPQGEAVVASTGEAAGGTAGSGAEAPSPSQPPSAAPDAEVLAAHEYVVKNVSALPDAPRCTLHVTYPVSHGCVRSITACIGGWRAPRLANQGAGGTALHAQGKGMRRVAGGIDTFRSYSTSYTAADAVPITPRPARPVPPLGG